MLLGVHDMNKEEKDYRQVRKVTKRVPHRCYDSTDKVNDIMLLKVRTAQYVMCFSPEDWNQHHCSLLQRNYSVSESLTLTVSCLIMFHEEMEKKLL